MSDAPVPSAELLGLFDDPVVLFDSDDRIDATNSAFVNLFASLPQFIRPGTPWSIFLSEAARKMVLSPTTCADLQRVGELLSLTPGDLPTVEASFADGGQAEVVLTALANGSFAMRFSMSGLAAQEEREIEQVMSKVLEACPTSLTMARVGDGQILYRSPSATELLGKGMNSRAHFARPEDRADFVTDLLPTARVDDMRITGCRGDGTEFPAAISARMIDYRGDDVVVYSILDLSDDIALQSELARQKDLTFRAEKMSALGELLAGVAHELNNPLSIVVGNMLILREEELDPAILGRVDKVSDAAERCVRIVRSFLAMAREKPLELDTVPVADIVDTAVDSFLAGAQGAEVDVVAEVPGDLPDLWVDETQIVQVLTNLLVNASQAISEAGVGDRIDLRVLRNNTSDALRLIVEDNGPGIPVEIADRVFDPLFTTKSAGKGTGVGLALCNRIVASHGGTIQLDQKRGGGACFLIDLPTVAASH